MVVADPNTFELVSPLTAESDTVDFVNGNTYFQTVFNDKASWTLTLTGNTSGAQKSYIGTSEFIDSTFVSWDGGFTTDGALKLFQDESVTASLKVFGIDEPFTYQMNINNPLNPFTVVSGFNIENERATFFVSADSAGENEAPLSNGTGDDFKVTYIDDISTSPEGLSYALIQGEDMPFTKEYFTGNYGKSGYLFKGEARSYLFNNPETEVYFNFFLKGGGTESTTKLELQLEERNDDKWVKEINTKFDGWKLITIQYNSFIDNYADASDNIKAPAYANGMSFLISSVPSRNKVEIGIDYPCFTIGKPLFETN